MIILRELIDDINKYGEGLFRAKVARNFSGISVAIPSKNIEYILFDKDKMTPGIWGKVIHYEKLTRAADDNGEWYSYLRRDSYDKIVTKLKMMIANKKEEPR